MCPIFVGSQLSSLKDFKKSFKSVHLDVKIKWISTATQWNSTTVTTLPLVHVGLDGCLLITSDANMVVSPNSSVAVYQTLLYLLSLVGCQDQFCGVMYLWVASARVLIVVWSTTNYTTTYNTTATTSNRNLLVGLQWHVMRIHNMFGGQWRRIAHWQAWTCFSLW